MVTGTTDVNSTALPFNILAELRAVRRLMSLQEVAKLLGNSRQTIARMAASRQIPSLLIGSSRKFDPSALILWLAKKDPTLAQAARHFGLEI